MAEAKCCTISTISTGLAYASVRPDVNKTAIATGHWACVSALWATQAQTALNPCGRPARRHPSSRSCTAQTTGSQSRVLV